MKRLCRLWIVSRDMIAEIFKENTAVHWRSGTSFYQRLILRGLLQDPSLYGKQVMVILLGTVLSHVPPQAGEEIFLLADRDETIMKMRRSYSMAIAAA
jgi:hypothetical protein